MIRSTFLDSDLLVISEEFALWEDSHRRIDLLAVDREANLVVIELKRDESGGHMDLQALRYAAMVSAMTWTKAVEVFGTYLEVRDREDDPEEILLQFFGWEEPNDEEFGQDVRIVLAAPDFGKELTTAVLWMNQRDLDIRCVATSTVQRRRSRSPERPAGHSFAGGRGLPDPAQGEGTSRAAGPVSESRYDSL